MVKFFPLLAIGLCISCHQIQRQQENAVNKIQSPLAVLAAGNERFQNGMSIHPHLTHERLEELYQTQNPIAVVISCSDSRVPPEIVFDQGLGDLFVVRTAGNTLSEIELGSVEYAIGHLNIGLILVMGHEGCGAVKAIVEGKKEEGELGFLLAHLKDEPEVKSLLAKTPVQVDEIVQANVRHVANQLKYTPGILSEKVKQGTVIVASAEYYLHDGNISFFKH